MVWVEPIELDFLPGDIKISTFAALPVVDGRIGKGLTLRNCVRDPVLHFYEWWRSHRSEATRWHVIAHCRVSKYGGRSQPNSVQPRAVVPRYLREFNSVLAASFFARLAAFFSFAVDAAGFFAAFWPLSLDISMSSFPGIDTLPLTIAHQRVGSTASNYALTLMGAHEGV